MTPSLRLRTSLFTLALAAPIVLVTTAMAHDGWHPDTAPSPATSLDLDGWHPDNTALGWHPDAA